NRISGGSGLWGAPPNRTSSPDFASFAWETFSQPARIRVDACRSYCWRRSEFAERGRLPLRIRLVEDDQPRVLKAWRGPASAMTRRIDQSLLDRDRNEQGG